VFKRKTDKSVRQMFETRSHSWREAGLLRELDRKRLSRARGEALVLLPLLVGMLVLYSNRRDIAPELDLPIRVATVVSLVILGWVIARAVGRILAPLLFRRLDPGTAGTLGFLIRLLTIAVAVLAALRIAGIQSRTLAVGGAFTAVIFGLAAQQTFGNLIAGTVLLSARPFRVGDRVRLQGGGVGGEGVEGVVSSLGLLYTTLVTGEDRVMVPNSVILGLAIIPLREPAAVDLRARLRADVRPSEVQSLLDDRVATPTKAAPEISLEEMDRDEVVVRIAATPEKASDGPHLADEILAALASVTGDGETADDRGSGVQKRADRAQADAEGHRSSRPD
jgi:small-conductance mechanosensitive channel